MNSTKQANDTGLTDSEIEAIRVKAKGIVEAEGLSQTAAARDANLAVQTFSAWLAGTYNGRNDRVAADVQMWLNSRAERKRAAAALPQAPLFIVTQTAQKVIEVLQWAQIGPDIAVVAGAAGIGKSTACEHYSITNPNVWLATMQPATATVHTMLQSVAMAIGVVERSAARLTDAIGRRLANTGGLLIVDEAQHLPAKCLDQLRSIFDLYGVGVVLVGNESVYARLEGGDGRRPEFAQLYSRVGMRLTRAKPYGADICALIKAWGVADKEAISFLKSIASKPGALRGLTKTLRLASMLAKGEGAPVSLKHVQAAYARLSDNGSSPASQAQS